MRMSGRKLRRAVGTGIAALMLTLGVSSVGATAPGPVGNIGPVVTDGGASAQNSSNTTVTAANYRDAVRVQIQTSSGGPATGLGGAFDGCYYTSVGDNTNGGYAPYGNPTGQPGGLPGRVSTFPSVIASCGGNIIIRPAAYPLWEVQTGTPGSNVLVVPPTQNPRNGTLPAKTYGIETFR